jgi:uncharacterized RDD family membrane protein YckC
MGDLPDFAKYTLAQLEESYKYLDKDKYPDRLQTIEAEIEKRKTEGNIQVEPARTSAGDDIKYNKYRTFWPRFWARMIDGIVFIPLDLIGEMAFGTAITHNALWIFSSVLIVFAYSVLMHGYFGQTIGKMIVRVRVLDISETKLSLRQAFFRDAVPIALAFLILIFDKSHFIPVERDILINEMSIPVRLLFYVSALWFFLELITMLSNKKRRALHDFIAGSVVVKINKKAK